MDPTDLLTHGLIVGMTGSGKTGLAIALIEEVLRQGVPVLAIDPKGDLGNLLLLFDHLEAAEFEPWIDRDAARREGLDVPAAAAAQSALWRKGLADWGLSASDVASLRAAREARIYTPGSSAGIALNVLQSLDAPAVPFASAEEDLRDEISGIVSGLLGLVQMEADPLRSPDAIFLSTLIEHFWREGKGLTLESLIPAVAAPPFSKLGALPLESVYPKKQRQALMLALNGLLASPAFEAWREGEPMDIDALFKSKDGRPRLSIVSTAHLSDQERLFVTALLLDKVKTWMRRQGGTTQLRALVYMDEIYGYFPPTANPPTKRPLLTLLKQARAQGVGVVLATQNPVDLDYKGLANIGTWLVGKLQTDQDRARLREGLLGSGVDAAKLDQMLDATAKRVFLLHDVHRKAPCLLHSRFALSYLRGPLTREEIGRLMHAEQPAAATAPAAAEAAPAGPPVLPSPWRHNYLSKYGADQADPYLMVKYAVRYKGAGEVVGLRAWSLDCPSAAEVLESEPLEVDEAAVTPQSRRAQLRYAELPEYLGASGARGLDKALRERLADKLAARFWYDPVSKGTSSPGEERDAFATRLREAGAGAQAARVQEKLEKKRRDLIQLEQDAKGRKAEKWMAIGSAILSNLGLFSGRKKTISGAGTVLSKNRMENTAEARVEALQAEIQALEQELAGLTTVDPARLEERTVAPSRTDVKVLRSDLLWIY
jgi:hypothetical protein